MCGKCEVVSGESSIFNVWLLLAVIMLGVFIYGVWNYHLPFVEFADGISVAVITILVFSCAYLAHMFYSVFLKEVS